MNDSLDCASSKAQDRVSTWRSADRARRERLQCSGMTEAPPPVLPADPFTALGAFEVDCAAALIW